MDLTEAFGIVPGDCVAVVGGGGKTTIMYRLAREAAARGRTALVGGTTRFTPPRHGVMPPPVIVPPDADPVPAIVAALAHERAVTCTTGHGDKGRWLPVSCEQVDALMRARVADLIALEADGSRNRPFKAPGENEPAVPSSASLVLAVAGLDAVGMPLTEEWVHRPERVASLAGAALGAELTPELITRVLLHLDGGRKSVPPRARWIAVLNKAEPSRRDSGETLARLLLDGGAERVVLTTADAAEPVAAIRTGSE